MLSEFGDWPEQPGRIEALDRELISVSDVRRRHVTVLFVQQRLVLKQIDLRRASVQEDDNNPFGARSKMCRTVSERIGIHIGSRRFIIQQTSQS